MTSTPLTLRDLRRMLTARDVYVYPDGSGIVSRRGCYAQVPSGCSQLLQLSALDAAIARHGARALLSSLATARPSSDKDEVGASPTPDEGGAHCSEPKPTATRSENTPSPQKEDSHCEPDQASEPASQAAEEDGDEPRPSEQGGCGSGESRPGAPEEPSEREATSSSPDPSAEATAPRAPRGADTSHVDADAASSRERGASASMDPGDQLGHRCTEGRPVTEVTSAPSGAGAPTAPDPSDSVAHVDSACAEADVDSDAGHRGAPHGGRHSQHFPRSPRLPTWAPGGDFALAAQLLERRIDRGLRGDARAVASALRQLLRTLDICGDDPSPRLDGRSLVTELVTRRYALARAQRRELAPAVVVLAADCSGSCSAVCDATLTACLAIAREMPHVLVVRHSNGEVIDASGVLAARLQPRDTCRLGEVPTLLGCLVAGTVAFGDWDAGHCYERLAASGAPLYWLDSYAACAGEPRPARARLRAGSEVWRHKPAGWYQGVNDAGAAAFALREMARKRA